MLSPGHLKKLSNKLWRLNNLYYITDKAGKQIRFTMTPEQLEYFEGMHTRNIILKARQLGFTTEVCIIQLDAALFESAKCALIAHTLNDAKRLFREKVKYAYDRLPEEIKQANPASNDAAGELVFKKGGSLYVSTSFRGGTLRYLHVSEFGKICAKFPDKAKEIVTGAFEAVATGCFITIESTAEGKSGYFYDYCNTAEKAHIQGKPLSSLDWKFFFFSWWKNPLYAIPPVEPIPTRLEEYFSEIKAKHGIDLTEQQKAWYHAKEKTLGDDMKREYPSIPSEAFEQSIEGAYYARQFRELYKEKRITVLPDNSHLPVYTYWDLGVGDSTAIWFVRKVGEEFHIIDYYENSGEGLRHYMKVLKDKAQNLGYEYAEHWAPHDIDNRELSGDGKSRKQIAKEGYEIDGEKYSIKFNVAPRLSVDDGIESVREILPLCAFDSSKCEQGIANLEAYRKAWDDKNGCWRDKPLHDHTSHGADAFRYFAVANRNARRQAFTIQMETTF
ncbi:MULTISPECIES: terminase [unclassified Gilliamella]|uniref:terminase n=1 Tax=unclassified Gilliamella TaxID=2685620 RepID=UPI00080E88D9|nr:terminase [Gilliamella apicola]OCG35729.1 terminase [Gilliamella apicola]OCG50766.1 terminase [Gilliamella apicola]OCG54291.1 terminase [Gilliamella apicola]